MKELIYRLAMEIAPSGCERSLSDVLFAEIKDVADEVYVDTLGNAIARKRGGGPHIMLAAHADEPGVMVVDIAEDGFLRLISVGNLAPTGLINRQIMFTNGTIGLVGVEEQVKLSDVTYDHLYVDIGAADKSAAEQCAFVGLSGVVVGDVQEMTSTRLVGRSLDNRVGCAIALVAFRELASSGHNVSVVFTAQNLVGAGGAHTAAYQLQPDLALVIDAVLASDVPEGKRTAIQLGKGPAIKIMDGTAIVPLDVKNLLQNVAQTSGLSYQNEVWPGGRSDAGAVQLSVDGIRIGGVSYPARGVGLSETIVDLADIEGATRLVVESAKAFALV